MVRGEFPIFTARGKMPAIHTSNLLFGPDALLVSRPVAKGGSMDLVEPPFSV